MTVLEIFNKITKDGILITDTVIQLDTDTYVTLFKAKKGIIARIDTMDDMRIEELTVSKMVRSLPESIKDLVFPAYAARRLHMLISAYTFPYGFAHRISRAVDERYLEEISEDDSVKERAEFSDRIATLKENLSNVVASEEKAKKY